MTLDNYNSACTVTLHCDTVSFCDTPQLLLLVSVLQLLTIGLQLLISVLQLLTSVLQLLMSVLQMPISVLHLSADKYQHAAPISRQISARTTYQQTNINMQHLSADKHQHAAPISMQNLSVHSTYQQWNIDPTVHLL